MRCRPRTGRAHADQSFTTTRVHHPSRWCGRLAARRTRAAAGAAGDRLSQRQVARRYRASGAGFRRGLAENGYVEGQTVTIESRWALGHPDRLPAMAAELVRKPGDGLASTRGASAALAAKAATSTIPIAFIVGGDAVKLGLAASYNRPGGNATRDKDFDQHDAGTQAAGPVA